jgi:hypothetical protein
MRGPKMSQRTKTPITVTVENTATKTAIRRSIPMAIEVATRRVFVGS